MVITTILHWCTLLIVIILTDGNRKHWRIEYIYI